MIYANVYIIYSTRIAFYAFEIIQVSHIKDFFIFCASQ